MKDILSLGVSPFVMGITDAVIGFALNGALSVYGDIYVSALTVMQTGVLLISVPLQGFCQGCVPVLSFNYGHRDPARLKQGYFVLLAGCFFYNLILTLWMLIFPGQLASLTTDDPALIAMVCEVMPWFIGGMTIFGLQRACQNTFVATNQAGVSIFIALLRKIILLVPLIYILPHFITPGFYGVYLAESVADFTAATCCTLIFIFRFPRIIRSLQDESVGGF